jgi:bifunctional UDP-N-acetylglucosamine pyrophosphorylase/glucosamine-1-phosphate N-acetyltransferase
MTAIVLAAGKSSRINLTLSETEKAKILSWLRTILQEELPPTLNNSIPKVILPLSNEPLILHILSQIREGGAKRIIVVINPNFDFIRKVIERRGGFPIEFVYQKEPKGTADAVKCCAPLLGDEDVLVVCGDTPLLKSRTFSHLYSEFQKGHFSLVMLSAILPSPSGYGRVLRDGEEIRIVEERDADEEVKRIKEVNAGVYLFHWPEVFPLLSEIKPFGNPPEEYLTALIPLIQKKGGRVKVVTTPNPDEVLGINTEEDYQRVQNLLKGRE